MVPTKTMKIFSVDKNLKYYTTTLKDRKYGLIKLPENHYRLYEEELKGSDDTEEESKEVMVHAPENIDTTITTDENLDIPDPNDDDSLRYDETEEFNLANSRETMKDLDPELLRAEHEIDHEEFAGSR